MSRHPWLDRARNDDGVTMIELLVAIIIVGILAGIAIPLFNSQRTKAQDATLKRDLHTVARAVESWYASGYGNTDATDIGSGYMYLSSKGSAAAWPFSADNATPTLASGSGMPTLSTGSGVGVRVIGTLGGYCILGSRANSSYRYGAAGVGADLSAILYYDSLLGGVKKRAQLSATGACNAFV